MGCWHPLIFAGDLLARNDDRPLVEKQIVEKIQKRAEKITSRSIKVISAYKTALIIYRKSVVSEHYHEKGIAKK